MDYFTLNTLILHAFVMKCVIAFTCLSDERKAISHDFMYTSLMLFSVFSLFFNACYSKFLISFSLLFLQSFCKKGSRYNCIGFEKNDNYFLHFT